MATDDEELADPESIRRTELARERTALAWWRSGITALGVAVAVGRVVPAVSDVGTLPYALLGAGYAVIGLVMVAYGSTAQRGGGKRPVVPSRVAIAVITVLALAIGVGTLVVVVAGA
jgi:putative membrane protein